MIRKAARLYANAGTGSIVYSMGITQHTTGTDNVLSVANLAMLTGNIGRESTASMHLGDRTTFRGHVTWAHCRTSIPVTNGWTIQKSRESSRRRGA